MAAHPGEEGGRGLRPPSTEMQRCRPKQPPLSCGCARAGSLQDRPEGMARESSSLPCFLSVVRSFQMLPQESVAQELSLDSPVLPKRSEPDSGPLTWAVR